MEFLYTNGIVEGDICIYIFFFSTKLEAVKRCLHAKREVSLAQNQKWGKAKAPLRIKASRAKNLDP